jgi:hypothetical protein
MSQARHGRDAEERGVSQATASTVPRASNQASGWHILGPDCAIDRGAPGQGDGTEPRPSGCQPRAKRG